MLPRFLRIAALVCTVVVATGWLWFAVDQSRAASRAGTAVISGQEAKTQADPDPDQERAREKIDGRVHEAIDDANDGLLRPFAAVTASSPSKWARRSVPALLALLVYGFGLAMLARYLATR